MKTTKTAAKVQKGSIVLVKVNLSGANRWMRAFVKKVEGRKAHVVFYGHTFGSAVVTVDRRRIQVEETSSHKDYEKA